MKLIFSKLIILGSGPAGLTSLIYSSRLNLKPILITGNNEGGKLQSTLNIENWPSEKNISGCNLYKKFLNHNLKNYYKIISDNIYNIDFINNKIFLFGKNKYKCLSLIIATGSSPNKLNIKGEKEYFCKGVSTCAICDGPLYKDKTVGVIGSGNTAVEEVIYLSNICKKIYLICRSNKLKSDYINITKLNNINNINKNILIFYNSNILEIIGDNKEINIILIKTYNNKNYNIKKIELSGLFIAIGNKPNTEIFTGKLELSKNYYIKINMYKNNFTSTNINGVFAAGDVVDLNYKQIITSSSLGCMAAIDAKNYLNKI